MLSHVKYRHRDIEGIAYQIDCDICLENPDKEVERFKFVEIVFLRDHGDDFTWQGWGVFRTGNVLRGIYCPTEDRVLEYAKDWEDAGCVDILVKNFSSREVFTYHRGVCTPVEEDVCADE